MFPSLMSDMFGNRYGQRGMNPMESIMNSVFGGEMHNDMSSMMMPFGGTFPFGSMMPPNPMMNGMNNAMSMMGNSNGMGQSFSSTTFMSYSSNGPNGQPQVYKASTSTRTGPGGIRETKKAVSDSRTGVKKLAVGHHIGDRGHIVERQQNLYSGEQEENQELINLDDDEAEQFNNEWRQKAQSVNSHRTRYVPYAPSGDILAIEGQKPIESGRKRSSKQRSQKKSNN
ncbi:myeloid leukemia factor isoform X2 [Adelges cooleyi]|uniref:myeloid leukemia factor isoform X2 n=1 Tax=Adelges cooleyi TaxID=133065 RepID=UPI00217F8507|nr:myeloid leukemia factor isoform X2 [Adelges cooleyi]